MWQMVEGMRGKTNDPLLEFTEVVTQEEQGVLTVWNWWAVPSPPMQGSALFKVSDQGVLWERLCFFTKLPEG